MYSKSTLRPIDEETPCPLCGAFGHVETPESAAGRAGAGLPLRCENGHTITLVGLEVVPSPRS